MRCFATEKMEGLMLKKKGLKYYGKSLSNRFSTWRNSSGIPVISSNNLEELYFGLGWVHANDRVLNLELSRLVARGRGAECLDPSLLQLDITMRRYNLWGDSLAEATKITGDELILANAYCSGVNERLLNGRLPFEFKLIGHRPEPWGIADSIAILKLIGLVDLTETQGWMEKFIIEMLRRDYPLDMLRLLFPYLMDQPDSDYLAILKELHLQEPIVPETITWPSLPRLQCSNNWVVGGKLTQSGKTIFCGDPHLDSSRLPAIWQEVVLSCDDFNFAGATIPGIPGLPMGRTDHMAWSPTYGNMDVIDYFIEDVREGKYLHDSKLRDFQVRREEFLVRKQEPLTLLFYENDHGVLEGEPSHDGYYLNMAWSGARFCGAESIKIMLQAPYIRRVDDLLDSFKGLDFAAFNWVAADTAGNIGYQMSGRNPIRKEGCSGLLPLPGWDSSYDWKGYYRGEENPRLYNPTCNYIVTANQDLNEYARTTATNLAMAPYRTRRISEMLEARDDHTVESMKKLQYDLYSKQAEDFMAIIRPLLPDSANGKILAQWDLKYKAESAAPYLFERIYSELIAIVFGELNFNPTVIDYLVHETVLMHDYYYNFDRILLSEESPWFQGCSRVEIFRKAIEHALAVKPEPYGKKQKVMMRNLFFGGRLPRWLGFDYGPLQLGGGRATISISQIFKTEGRTSTFSPAYRFITDFRERKIHSVLAGGPSDRRFSKYYTSGVRGWLKGDYNAITLPRNAPE
jgi:penicillin G amidase